jgi:carbonic anhydrase/acetyltransferase-like protein (isoleucine patch superfamily)
MPISHGGKSPKIDPAAWVAPDATVCGDVTVGPGTRIMHGARVIGEGGGRISIGRDCIVMENAVIRAGARHDCSIGDHCLIGPQTHVTGAAIEDEVFVATGASVFHGARIGRGAEVRINAVVHIKTVLEAGATVPIGWVAVGDPAEMFSPDRHDEIWARQAPLDFPGWVYGLDRTKPGLMVEITRRLSVELGAHEGDGEG